MTIRDAIFCVIGVMGLCVMIVAAPFQARATLEPMTDDEMRTVVGQGGFSADITNNDRVMSLVKTALNDPEQIRRMIDRDENGVAVTLNGSDSPRELLESVINLVQHRLHSTTLSKPQTRTINETMRVATQSLDILGDIGLVSFGGFSDVDLEVSMRRSNP